MPSQFFNFSKYLKKDKKPEDNSTDKNVPIDGPTSTTTSTQNTVAGAQSYSGIGNPPQPKIKTVSSQNIQTGSSTSPAAATTLSESSIDAKKRASMDILSRLTQRSSKVLLVAANKAKEFKGQYIDTEHVLWALLQDSSIYQLISECKVTPSELQTGIETMFKKENHAQAPQFSPRVKRVLETSLSIARSLGFEFISPEHILLALSHEGEGAAAQILAKHKLTQEVLNKKITGKEEIGKEDDRKKSSTLELYAEDLTAKAKRGELDPVVGRSWEIERIIHILSRRTKNNPVVIGEAGVGKTAIVEGLALRIANGNVPETLLNKRILSLDLMSLIAGAKHRGEFEERLKNLIKEVKAGSGSIILFIDELHNMVGAGSGSEGTMDASNILKPSLARGELQTIGSTTVTEYRKHIEKDPALERRFQPVNVSEPTADTAIEMLMALRDKYEAFHRVKISDEAVEAAVRLSQRYIGDRFLPDKAVDLIDEAGASVRLPAISLPEEIQSAEGRLKKLDSEVKEAEKIGDKVREQTLKKEIEEHEKSLKELKNEYQVKKSTTTNVVTPEIIAEIVSKWTKIPIKKLTESESTKLLDLEGIIHKRLINQEQAVLAVSEAVRRGRAGLKSNKRPIGSFIFMGPTGVGKTELAKTIAEILFGSEEMMVRIDMTEYMEKHEVAKLIGAPPGYVGYEEGGQLTEAVRRHPYSVVLFDEIEKAHPDVFNILIQILDDGRLTDNKGHTISFKNTIIICTSNLGSGIIQEEMLGWKREDDSLVGVAKNDIAQEKMTGKNNNQSEVIKTYAVSPTGRHLVTFKNKLWEKDANNTIWKEKTLEEYFAGSIIVEGLNSFPVDGIDSHVIAPDGSEVITRGELCWWRTSTTVKQWHVVSLLEKLKGFQVENMHPDKPDEQLPTAKYGTHAISANETEVISLNDRFWKRENLKVDKWVTDTLDKYFEGASLATADKEEVKETRTDKEEKPENGKEKNLTEGNNLINRSEVKETQPDFPKEHWDIHFFKPSGEEIITCGGNFWLRKNVSQPVWTRGKLEDLISQKEIEGKKGEEIPLGISVSLQSEEVELNEERFNKLADRLMDEMKKFFRPELLNRYDEIVIFKPLTKDHMGEIVGLQVKYLAKLLLEQNISISINDKAREYLSKVGFDPIFGARPLRRTLQRLVENQISSRIIKGEVKSGDTIIVDFDGYALSFLVKKFEGIKPAEEPNKSEEEKLKPGEPGLKIDTYECHKCGAKWQVSPDDHQKGLMCPTCKSLEVKKEEVLTAKTEEKKEEGLNSGETEKTDETKDNLTQNKNMDNYSLTEGKNQETSPADKTEIKDQQEQENPLNQYFQKDANDISASASDKEEDKPVEGNSATA